MRKGNKFFSRMNRIKTDRGNRLGQKCLDNLMIRSEEGPSVENFNPDHAINAWYSKKMRRFGGETSHKYPAKTVTRNTRTIDLARK